MEEENENENETEEGKAKSSANIFGPEGFIMLSIAVFIDGAEIFLDLAGIILTFLFGVGLFLHGISSALDLIAGFIFGTWILIRKGASKNLVDKKRKQSFFKSKLFCFIVEQVPVISFLWPGWIILVYQELKNK